MKWMEIYDLFLSIESPNSVDYKTQKLLLNRLNNVYGGETCKILRIIFFLPPGGIIAFHRRWQLTE